MVAVSACIEAVSAANLYSLEFINTGAKGSESCRESLTDTHDDKNFPG